MKLMKNMKKRVKSKKIKEKENKRWLKAKRSLIGGHGPSYGLMELFY
jgi:hypothetical protein